MNVRIISGKYGGRKIDAPDTDKTHPMGERIRNALFNSIGQAIVGGDVLDVFAGTGAIGIEAISRGAARATFVEKDRVAQQILVGNITTLGASDQATIIRTSVLNWLTTIKHEQYDFIFVDPPYDDMQFSTVEQLFPLLKVGGRMVLSHPGRSEAPTKPGVVVVDNRSYGNAVLTSYRREAAE